MRKNKTGKIILLLAIFSIGLYINYVAFRTANIRIVYLSAVLIAALFTVLTSLQFYWKFVDIRKNSDSRAFMNKQKFIAEIAAGVAMFAFAGTLYTHGMTIDLKNTEARDRNVSDAIKLINEIAPSSYCSTPEKLYRKIACVEIKKYLDAVKSQLIFNHDEKEIARALSMAIYYLDSSIRPDLNMAEKYKLDRAKDLLQNVDITDQWISQKLIVLYLALLFASSIAISRKVAIAAFDAFCPKDLDK